MYGGGFYGGGMYGGFYGGFYGGMYGRGERSRSKVLFKLGGTENMRILVVNVLTVNFWLLIFGC